MNRTVSRERFDRAALCLQQGGVVAFPTETYYGLAVDPFNPAALERLFLMKQRSAHKPILTLIEHRRQLSLLAREIPPVYELLMDRFWPGPLTLVCPGRPDLPAALTADTGTVGIRIPGHSLARRLVAAFGRPVTGTSANISGRPAATTVAELQQQFGDTIDLVLDGGATPGGKGSTVVGLDRNGSVRVIRDGVIAGHTLVAAIDGEGGLLQDKDH